MNFTSDRLPNRLPNRNNNRIQFLKKENVHIRIHIRFFLKIVIVIIIDLKKRRLHISEKIFKINFRSQLLRLPDLTSIQSLVLFGLYFKLLLSFLEVKIESFQI